MVKTLGQMEENAIGRATTGCCNTRDPPKKDGFLTKFDRI
jgi:hypothetical protein